MRAALRHWRPRDSLRRWLLPFATCWPSLPMPWLATRLRRPVRGLSGWEYQPGTPFASAPSIRTLQYKVVLHTENHCI